VYDQLGYLVVDGEIILQWILSKEGVTAYSTFNWFAVKEKAISTEIQEWVWRRRHRDKPDRAWSGTAAAGHYAGLCRFVSTARSAHTAYLYVLCGSENKQRLFPYTTLTDWFFNKWDGVCLLRGTDWVFMCFVWIWEQTALTDWFLFLRRSVYCAVRTGSLCVLCGSENKQRLFPYTALTDFYNWDGVFTAWYGLQLYTRIIQVNLSHYTKQSDVQLGMNEAVELMRFCEMTWRWQ
jgi:hypothetical protein